MSVDAKPGPNPKIIDLVSSGTVDGKPFVSLEYFPPRTEEGVKVCSFRLAVFSIRWQEWTFGIILNLKRWFLIYLWIVLMVMTLSEPLSLNIMSLPATSRVCTPEWIG
jgi:hypothetical protein